MKKFIKLFAIIFLIIFATFYYLYFYKKNINIEKCEIPKSFKFYGQGLEYGVPTDKFIFEKFFKKKCHGVFIDIGANDGITHSNTKFFEETLKWKGYCIEPNPKTFKTLLLTRPLCNNRNVGFSEKENGEMQFLLSEGPANELSGFEEFMSTEHKERLYTESKNSNNVIEKIFVKSFRLDKFIESLHIKNIDMISLDAEGAELSILKGYNFSHNINLWIVENNQNMNIIKEIFLKNGYIHCGEDLVGINSLFCKK
jgi:FkbM family methyltransferase